MELLFGCLLNIGVGTTHSPLNAARYIGVGAVVMDWDLSHQMLPFARKMRPLPFSRVYARAEDVPPNTPEAAEREGVLSLDAEDATAPKQSQQKWTNANQLLEPRPQPIELLWLPCQSGKDRISKR